MLFQIQTNLANSLFNTCHPLLKIQVTHQTNVLSATVFVLYMEINLRIAYTFRASEGERGPLKPISRMLL